MLYILSCVCDKSDDCGLYSFLPSRHFIHFLFFLSGVEDCIIVILHRRRIVHYCAIIICCCVLFFVNLRLFPSTFCAAAVVTTVHRLNRVSIVAIDNGRVYYSVVLCILVLRTTYCTERYFALWFWNGTSSPTQ